MKRCLGVVLVLCFAFVVTGCTAGLQVQNNTYDSLGGKVIKVNDEFTYLGDCDPTIMTTKEGGRAKVHSDIATRGDVFAKCDHGKPQEFVILQRMKVNKTGWGWNPIQGKVVEFYGTRYKGNAFDLSKGEGATFRSYADFAAQKGYTIDDADYLVCSLSRNVGQQLQVSIIYGIHKSLIPEDVLNDEEKLDAFTDEYIMSAVKVL